MIVSLFCFMLVALVIVPLEPKLINSSSNILFPTCPTRKGSKAEVLYGLDRTILSAIGTPTCKLAEFCDQLLKPLTNNKYTRKDSFSFAKEVLQFKASLFMTSFDI